MERKMKIIGHIETGFEEKFGIPRQSGMVSARGKIVFKKEYSVPEAFRELEGFSHIWILWEFSKAVREKWSPTVRPPILGGNKRVGVFATRSPFRPNPIGMSCVKLEKIEHTKDEGVVLYVSGVDMLSGTPVYDIKPYIPYADLKEDAAGGFSEEFKEKEIPVFFPESEKNRIPEEKREEIRKILALDPRPQYKNEEESYGLKYSGYEIKFKVENGILIVVKIEEYK